jgi:NAD(P)-dependent dehydrogenase (short-subunit alcohol dehydrogenase family)
LNELHSDRDDVNHGAMKTALVFGAAGGLGRAITTALQAAEVRVLGVARDETALPGLEVTSADLTVEHEVASACMWAAQEAGSVDLLVFAAGRMGHSPLAQTSAEALHRLWADNLLAAHLINRHATALLAPQGHRVFLGAYVDKLQFPQLGAYAAAKAGLDAWVRVLIREERALKTTLLRLPAVDTALWKQAPFPLPKGALAPATVGDEVVRCWREGKTGVVDLGASG